MTSVRCRNTVAGDATAWHVGASYTAGPFAVGVTYADAEGAKADGVTTYASDYKTYGGGVAYTLAPGFVVQADLMYVDEEVRQSPALVLPPTTKATLRCSAPA